MNTRNFGSDHSEETPEQRWHALSVAGEEGYVYEPPRRISLGRVVGVIVLMHVIAVGGVLAFRWLGDEGESSIAESSSSESPAKSTTKRDHIYYVKAGDDLPSIARLYDASVAQLKSVNKLSTGDELYVGQRLIIPADPQKPTPPVNPGPIATTIPETPKVLHGRITTGEDKTPQPEEKPLVAQVYEVPDETAMDETEPKIGREDPEPEEPKFREPIRATPIVISEDKEPAELEDAPRVMAQADDPSRDNGGYAGPIVSPQPSYEPEPEPSPRPEPVPEASRPLPTLQVEEEHHPVVARVIPMDQLPEDDGPLATPEESKRQLPTIGSNPAPEGLPKAIPFHPKRDPQLTSRNPRPARTYTVQPGDTFYAIAQRFGVSPKELMQYNGLKDPRQLRAGSVIQIP